ncbi:flagellar hook-length control protein FliK, partial [bacterium]|nr:flagellar hook-length control protein FliK [bacterium]
SLTHTARRSNEGVLESAPTFKRSKTGRVARPFVGRRVLKNPSKGAPRLTSREVPEVPSKGKLTTDRNQTTIIRGRVRKGIPVNSQGGTGTMPTDSASTRVGRSTTIARPERVNLRGKSQAESVKHDATTKAESTVVRGRRPARMQTRASDVNRRAPFRSDPNGTSVKESGARDSAVKRPTSEVKRGSWEVAERTQRPAKTTLQRLVSPKEGREVAQRESSTPQRIISLRNRGEESPRSQPLREEGPAGNKEPALRSGKESLQVAEGETRHASQKDNQNATQRVGSPHLKSQRTQVQDPPRAENQERTSSHRDPVPRTLDRAPTPKSEAGVKPESPRMDARRSVLKTQQSSSARTTASEGAQLKEASGLKPEGPLSPQRGLDAKGKTVAVKAPPVSSKMSSMQLKDELQSPGVEVAARSNTRGLHQPTESEPIHRVDERGPGESRLAAGKDASTDGKNSNPSDFNSRKGGEFRQRVVKASRGVETRAGRFAVDEDALNGADDDHRGRTERSTERPVAPRQAASSTKGSGLQSVDEKGARLASKLKGGGGVTGQADPSIAKPIFAADEVGKGESRPLFDAPALEHKALEAFVSEQAKSGPMNVASGRQATIFASSRTIVPDVVARIKQLYRSGRKEMRIRLDPPRMGQMRITIGVVKGAVRATLLVDQSQAQALLEDNLSSLSRSLQEQGLKVDSLSVMLSDESGEFGLASRDGSDGHGRGSGHLSSGPGSSFGDQHEEPTMPIPPQA